MAVCDTEGSARVIPCNNRHCVVTGAWRSRGSGMRKATYQCPNCQQSYSHKASLSRHLRYECGKVGQFHCNLCPYNSKRKANLVRHYITLHSMPQM
ncbi:hypothetical protein PR048_000164 [Dryococelus australis]|uniref:C2H2-type domain-containing protein n=1 Tax=Dryococelus australis TaxID=614101 RepID=A0ABQ9IDW9_9NEOP|nr:hypothetical protein PR048_000164 [Dryococelus australis]